MTAVDRLSGLSWRVGGAVGVVLLITLLWPLAPHIVAADAGHHVVLGGARLPAAPPGGAQPDAVTWYASAVEITNAGMLPVRIASPRPVTVDDGARVSVRIRLPRTGGAGGMGDPGEAGNGAADDGGAENAAVVGRGGTAELWVTIGQPGCAPGGSPRVERGLRGIAVDVTTLGVTRSVTLDLDLAAYVEAGTESLPPCE